MSTKKTVSLIAALGLLLPAIIRLVAKDKSTDWFILDLLASLISFGLLLYAFFREQTVGDKSETISTKATVVVFCAVGSWVAFIFYRALTHS